MGAHARMALSDLPAQLDPQVSWQVHRATLVNMNEVASMRRETIIP
jgi:DNA-binding LytR/AlgR family response regulator